MSVFEIAMLVCFGVSWPVSIRRSLVSRSTGGKSLLFMILIIIGYIAGVLHKLLYSRDFVVLLYALNALMVSVDLCLYFRNRKLERAKEALMQ
jgi:hypothetical protein